MALEIKSFGAVTDASGTLSTEAQNYGKALADLQESIAKISWEGQDAAAYKERVGNAIAQLTQIENSLKSQANYLGSVVNVISTAQSNIANKLRG